MTNNSPHDSTRAGHVSSAERMVVVVDDDPLTQQLINGYLEPLRIAMIGVNTGENAVAIIKRVHPTFVTMDLMLSYASNVMNGWDVLNAIRRDPELDDIPVIAISAWLTAEIAQEAIEKGFALALRKPITPEIFYPAVRHILRT